MVEKGDAPAPRALVALVRPRQAWLLLGAAFIVFHLTAMLVRGAPPALRDWLWPVFASYGDGLKMTSGFGVFARYTSSTSVAIYGVAADGKRHLLSHSAPAGRKLVDARITKIQRKFVHEDMRELLGKAYLAYFCRNAAKDGLALEKTELELLAHDTAAHGQVVLSVSCETPHG